jgi:D-sedoheptulose 7-phosphate isomerase
MELSTPKLATLQKSLNQSWLTMQKMASSTQVWDQVLQASELIRRTYLNQGCLFVAGNGGSAADAQHMVAELVSKLQKERTPIRAFALTVDTSILSAVGNDYGYEYVFSRQIEALMRTNDVFLGITTSGNSKNILKALEKCKEKGIPSILMTGASGGKARALADFLITVPAEETRYIQECHTALYHTLCQLIEDDLIAEGLCEYQLKHHQPTYSELRVPERERDTVV